MSPMLPILAALALMATPVAAQPTDWRTAAPALPLQGAVRPITTPVAIGGTGWGPWRSICREQTLRPGRPPQRDCLTVAEARPEAGGTRLILAQQGSGLLISVMRGADGRITEFAALQPNGTAPPPDEARERLLAVWREKFATLSLAPRRIGPRQDFPFPVEGSPRGGICRPEGLSTIARRTVLVALCVVELAGNLGRTESRAQVAIVAHVAIDVATGMVVAQGYASRVETFAANGRSNGVVVTPSRVVVE